LSPSEAALFAYGKKVIEETFENLKAFITTMVPLTTGLITVYFALLQFLGIKEAGQGASRTIGSWEILWPEWLFIASLVAFIAASFPIIRTIAPGNLQSISLHRHDSMRWKYGCILVGLGFFFSGLIKMVLIAIQVVGP
jgi:hypothetical protein